MRKLKFMKISSLLLFVTIASMAVISGCKDDPVPVVEPADFTALKAKITEAEALISSTTEGTDVGDYEIGSQLTLHRVVTSAEIVVASGTSDQAAVDITVTQLQGAMDTYGTKQIEAIDPATLVGYWKFDEGSGTTVADAASGGFDGTFNTGRANWGAGDPAWAEDRNGTANKAIAFNEGAWIEVPYNAALNPAQITIALWVNAAEVRESNRFLGLHSWNGYKFQLQSANKAFFTASAVDGIYDKDTDPVLNLDQWYHLAVSFGGGEMIFYINGSETNRVPSLTGDLVTVTGHNLAIGVGSSKYADTPDNYDNDQIIPEAWGGFFNGSLDELRIYNTVLSGPQVKSIYDEEK
jgi:concanavalin A-like lectin/glucanase superfamily protein